MISNELQKKIKDDKNCCEFIMTPIVNYKIEKKEIKEMKNKYIPKSNFPLESINLILEQINFVLLNNGIKGTINKENRKGKYTTFGENNRILCSVDMFRLFVRSKMAVEQFYHFLYDQSSIYLERKRNVFENNMSAFIYQKPRKAYANTELTNQIAQG
jgi:hypothetical protein